MSRCCRTSASERMLQERDFDRSRRDGNDAAHLLCARPRRRFATATTVNVMSIIVDDYADLLPPTSATTALYSGSRFASVGHASNGKKPRRRADTNGSGDEATTIIGSGCRCGRMTAVAEAERAVKCVVGDDPELGLSGARALVCSWSLNSCGVG